MDRKEFGLQIVADYLMHLPRTKLEAEFNHRAQAVRQAMEAELAKRRAGGIEPSPTRS